MAQKWVSFRSASTVIVAQKHMADISQKLTEIKEGIASISDFLEEGRRSVIQGTYQYLAQAYEALAQGDLSQAIRGELESCERDLLAIQNHLVANCQAQARVAPKDDDNFGTESLHKNGVAKYSKLGRSISDLDLCVKTRALCWYVLSLYPGEQSLKTVRRKNIEQGLEMIEEVEHLIHSNCLSDLKKFKSSWNFADTLSARKGDVSKEAEKVQCQLLNTRSDILAQLSQTEALLIERDRPTQLIVELLDGQVKQIRQRDLEAV